MKDPTFDPADPALTAIIPEEGLQLIEAMTAAFRTLSERPTTTDDEQRLLQVSFAIVLSALTKPEVLEVANAALHLMHERMRAERQMPTPPPPRRGESEQFAALRGVRRRPRGH